MVFKIDRIDSLRLFCLTYSGKISSKVRFEALDGLIQMIHEHDSAIRYNVLIDGRDMESEADFSESYDFGVKIAEYPELRGIRIADLGAPKSNDSRFIIDVSSNRGLLIREFDDYYDAIDWLAGIKEPEPHDKNNELQK